MKRFFASLVLFFIALPACAYEKIEVITFNAPPYSITSSNPPSGFVTEIVQQILLDIEQNAVTDIYPLQRGLYEAQRGTNTLIYPLQRQPQYENQFHWIGQVSSAQNYLFRYFTREDIQLQRLSDAKAYSVGVVRGSHLLETLEQHGIYQTNTVTDGLQNIHKLQRDRIDLIASDEIQLNHLIDNYNRTALKKLKLEHFQKVLAIPSQNNNMYIAMGKNADPELVEVVKKAFDAVMHSGALIEVAHFWTNSHEQAHVDVYKEQLAALGYRWVDYTFDGGGGGNLAAILEARQKNNHLPHAIQNYTGPQIKAWAEAGILLPLDDIAQQQQWEKHLPQSIRDSISYQGHYYAAPINLQRVNWMWVNAKLFRDAGIALPRSWDDFFAAADRLQRLGITPVALGDYSWQQGTLFESMVLGIGGKAFHAQAFIELDAEVFRSETMARILQSLRRVIGYTDRTQNGQTWVQATQSVIEGKAAVYFMGDWVRPLFNKHQFPYGEDGYLCLPAPGTQGLFLSNVDTFTFPDAGEHAHAAQKALAATVMDLKVQEVFNLHKGAIAARKDVPAERFDPCSQMSIQLAAQTQLIPSFNFIQAQPKAIQQPVIGVINRFIRSGQSIKDAQDELYQIVRSYKDSIPAQH